MTTDDKEIVSALRARLADKVGWQRFELWFTGTRFRVGQDALTVDVPNSFSQEWLRNHFRRDLEATCNEILARKLTVRFEVDARLAEATRGAPSPDTSDAESAGADSAKEKSASKRPQHPGERPKHAASPQAVRSSTRRARPLSTFDDLAPGAGNHVACTSAQLVARQPGAISPFIVYGATGLGKTHLLEAIVAAARQQHPQLQAVYLTAEQFTISFLEALAGRGLPSFRRKYRGVDLLVVDDVHFIAGKQATQTELLHTIDTLLRAGKQMVFAADRPPAELAGMGPELAARLTGGLVCRVESPDFQTRLGIVERLSKRLKVELAEELRVLVATHIAGNAREIMGALHRLHAASLAQNQPLSRAMAEESLAELAAANQPMVRLPDIQRAVCDVFGLTPASLQSARKAKAVSYPRMLAMFLARKYTRAALSEIGQFFGRRSHSTVISANKKVSSWVSQQRTFSLDDHAWNVEDALRRVEDRLKTG